MPYRALTHNRIKGFLTENSPSVLASGNIRAKRISSQKGLTNSGPISIQKNKSEIFKNHTSTVKRRTRCTGEGSLQYKCSFLMSPNAYGTSSYSSGEGKGYPNATPQTSVGSTNAFARRAIARRAVTTLVNDGQKKDCVCGPQPIKNLKGAFLS